MQRPLKQENNENMTISSTDKRPQAVQKLRQTLSYLGKHMCEIASVQVI